jgi:hypothetical protein
MRYGRKIGKGFYTEDHPDRVGVNAEHRGHREEGTKTKRGFSLRRPTLSQERK